MKMWRTTDALHFAISGSDTTIPTLVGKMLLFCLTEPPTVNTDELSLKLPSLHQNESNGQSAI